MSLSVVLAVTTHGHTIEQRKKLIEKDFNRRLVQWYENARLDYGVIGSGRAYFDELPREAAKNYIVNVFHVYYEEDGVKYHSTFEAHDSHLLENHIDWLFDIWAGSEMPTTKEAQPEQASNN